MSPAPRAKDPSRRSVRVRREGAAVVVSARGHTWVALADEAGERVREESGARSATFAVEPGTYTVTTDGRLEDVSTEALEGAAAAPAGEGALQLSSDAQDHHVVDGVGEIPADGSSSCTLTIQKVSAAGRALRGREHTDEVFVRTTGGTLQDDAGKPLRSIALRGGRATLRLVSEPVPRVVTVEAFGRPPLASGSLRIEFVAP